MQLLIVHDDAEVGEQLASMVAAPEPEKTPGPSKRSFLPVLLRN